MGRVRTKTVKRSARQIIENYYHRLHTDFSRNKYVCTDVARIPSKRLRNKIAGYVTHMMIRLKKGNVRSISLKLQEAERERKQDQMPDRSITEVDGPVQTDKDTIAMLNDIKVNFAVKEVMHDSQRRAIFRRRRQM